MVHKNPHYDTLYSALKDKPNIRFRLEMGKDHSPNYTADAVAYKTDFFNAFNDANKKKLLADPEQQAAFMSKYDWHRMTEQDSSVWDAILDALK